MPAANLEEKVACPAMVVPAVAPEVMAVAPAVVGTWSWWPIGARAL